MSSQADAPALRQRRGGSPDRDAGPTLASSSNDASHKVIPAWKELMADHPAIKPLIHQDDGLSAEAAAGATDTRPAATSISHPPPSVRSLQTFFNRVLDLLLKPIYFIPFAILHIGLELMVSVRTMKTFLQVFFLPHQFPIAPELNRILQRDLGNDLQKRPKHLAVILSQDGGGGGGGGGGEDQEEEWHARVAQLVQWSVASGVKCLSVMRVDPIPQEWVELLQERIDDALAEFYKEESHVPTARVRTLNPIEDSLQTVLNHRHAGVPETDFQRQRRLHGDRTVDLDVVILSVHDGHDRLAANVRALGGAALQRDIQSKDITMEFLDKQLSAELTEPELLIVFKDDLDLSSYPPWHIRLTEIFHHPDQAIIPPYTLFLQALHRYAKCEQRFGK
ncbi:hypothetical protein EDD11_003033 [Mortierella claussenii]|nr:hypothetical protein EDD11_003033 [Mortierella claussenii]